MRYLGAQSDAKDLVAQEQLSALISNPMTSIRDLIVGGVGGAPTRLAGPTSEGMVLTRIGNALAWAIATGFANPMTAGGDMIIGGSKGAATRLAGGDAGQVLTMVAGAPAWVTPSGGGGMTNPMTAAGDLITGGASGSPQRLPAGSTGQVLTVTSSGALVWATPSSGGGGTGDFKSDGSVAMSGAINEAPGRGLDMQGTTANLASVNANTILLNATSDINALGGGTYGRTRRINFQQNCTLKHNVNLIDLPTKADIAVKAGDWAEFFSFGGDSWLCYNYLRKDGTALAASAGFTEAQVRATPLTGLSTSNSGQIAAADTILAALGKLQAQLNGSVFRMETIATSTAGQISYAVPNGYTAGQIQVWFNGVLLQPSEYTATDGANVVLQTGAISTSDVMQVGVLGSLRTQDDALLQYTVANLPSASANAFKQRWCTNMAGGAGVVVSNGTNWVRVADNTVVTV